MKFALIPKEWNGYFMEALEQIKLAEKYNYDSVWFEEHHANELYIPSPISALYSVFSHTRLRLGCIIILPLYHPYRLAEELSLLDLVSNGRVIIGVVTGYREVDFKNFGINLTERSLRMDEGLKLLTELLSKDVVNFEGKIYKVSQAKVIPRPFQKPRPSIWVGAWKRKAIKRAALLGDAWLPGQTATLSEVIKLKQIFEEEAKSTGKQIVVWPIIRDAYISENDDKAIEEAKSSIEAMYQQDYSASTHPLVGGYKMEIEEWIKDRFIIGSYSTAIEMVDKIKKSGFNYLILRLSLRRLKHEQIKNSIQLFGEKVMPYFSEYK